MPAIYELSLPYIVSKSYLNFCFKQYYSEITVLGKENLPQNEPFIFAPNHNNALMDALAIASLVKAPHSTVFLARADLFRNPIVARLMRFSKIMPAFRMIDGVQNLAKNQETFDACVDVLENNHSLCIMPEGNQEIEHRLRPIRKGIFRVAFAAQKKLGRRSKVKIVPVGLDYGHLEKYGKHLIINIGKPIEVTDYMAEYTQNPVKATNEIRKKLHSDLSHLSFNLATDRHYSSFLKTVEVLQNHVLIRTKKKNTLTDTFEVRRNIARDLVDMEHKNIAAATHMVRLTNEYMKQLGMVNLRTNWYELRKQSYILNIIGLLISFPIFAYGFLFNIIPFHLPVLLRKHIFKAKFRGFFSSLQWSTGIVIFPLFYGLVGHHMSSSEGMFPTMLILLSAWISGKFAVKYYGFYKKTNALARLRKIAKKEPARISRLEKLRGQIIELYEKV